MSYVFIKKSDVKMFKSFLSGKEIEVGIRVSATANVFGTGDEVDIFYENDSFDSYRARIIRQNRKLHNMGAEQQALIMLCLVKS